MVDIIIQSWCVNRVAVPHCPYSASIDLKTTTTTCKQNGIKATLLLIVNLTQYS